MQSSSHGPKTSESPRPNIVLYSGGVDSTVVAVQAIHAGLTPDLLFIDYGQPARRAERHAATQISAKLELRLRTLVVDGVHPPSRGEIPFRNALLITVAAAAVPTAGTIVIGIHGGTGYADCTPEFISQMQAVFGLHGGDRPELVGPLIRYQKPDVLAIAADLQIPFELTHSCESGDSPCGTCNSCLDRGSVGAC